MNRAILAIALALGATAAGAADGIWRCQSAQGTTYQQVPCGDAGTLAAIPTDYPPVNTAERDRLLAREAALDQRLEAQRERLSREAAQRVAREERVLQEAPAAPVLVVVRHPRRAWHGARPTSVR